MNSRKLSFYYLFQQQLKEASAKVKAHLKQEKRLITNLKQNQVKFDENNILLMDQDKDGNILFLERGNHNADYKHILCHDNDFKKKGISIYQLPQMLFNTLIKKEVIGYQGLKKGRPIYRSGLTDNSNSSIDIAITVGSNGSNGFIVGANPVRATRKYFSTPGSIAS